MKALKISFITLAAFVSFGFSSYNSSELNDTKVVYVCGKSKIYHRIKSHSALGRCKSGITKMSEAKAKDAGKRVCKCRG